MPKLGPLVAVALGFFAANIAISMFTNSAKKA